MSDLSSAPGWLLFLFFPIGVYPAFIRGKLFAGPPASRPCRGGKVGFMPDTTKFQKAFEEIVEWGLRHPGPRRSGACQISPAFKVVDEPPLAGRIEGGYPTGRKEMGAVELSCVGLYSGHIQDETLLRPGESTPPDLILFFSWPHSAVFKWRFAGRSENEWVWHGGCTTGSVTKPRKQGGGPGVYEPPTNFLGFVRLSSFIFAIESSSIAKRL